MSNCKEINLSNTLTSYAQRIYNANEIPYEWHEVVELIEADPEIFNVFVRRAKRYILPNDAPKSHKLWISCNLARGFMVRNDCYLCGKVMKREEILVGAVHLEHFFPRSEGGDHIPGNISLVCKPCNLLKRNYQESDFDQLLYDPDSFRKRHPSIPMEKIQKLIDFTEIIAPRYKGNNWFIERHHASSQNGRQVLDDLKAEYRRKWMKEI